MAKITHNYCLLGGLQCSAPASKSKSANIVLAVLGAHMWAKWSHNPCHLGGPLSRDKLKDGSKTLTILVAQGWAKWRCNPTVYGVPHVKKEQFPLFSTTW